MVYNFAILETVKKLGCIGLFVALVKFNHDHEEKTSFRSWLPSSYVVLKKKHNNNALLVDTLNRIINKNCLITNLMMGMTKEKHVLTFFMCIRISGKISPLTQNALNFICKLTRFSNARNREMKYHGS